MRLPWRTAEHSARLGASRKVAVLLIDDDEDEYALVRDAVRDFEDTDFDLSWVDSYGAGREAIMRREHDVYLVDYRLGGANGIDLVREARAAGIRAPLIMLTGQREREVDMAAMEAGAVDFLVKGRTDPALLERTIRYAITQAEAAMALERSLAQVEALETAGRLLAERGVTPESLDAVTEAATDRLGQAAAAVYVREGDLFVLAAQRGYGAPVPRLDPASGRLTQVVTTGQPAAIPAVGNDPDAPSVWGLELAVPFMNRGRCAGVLLVAGPGGEPPTGADHHAVLALGDRVAVAMALLEEREELAAHASRMGRLVGFARTIGASLEADRVHAEVARAAAEVVGCDIVLLGVREPDGADVIRAAHGAPHLLGARLQAAAASSEGVSVRSAPLPVEGDAALDLSSSFALADLRLEREDRTLGRLVLARRGGTFTAGETEALRMVGGLVVLALTNAASHEEVAEQSVRDPLTGLPNRRYFDLSVEQLAAQRARQEPERRQPLAAILYDLDSFGEVNKRHGHAVGDEVLRAFAEVLRSRVRQSDVVGRYGGEEFAVVMLDATREDAVRVAEAVRVAFAEHHVRLPDGSPLTVSVSAGCAEVSPEEVGIDSLFRTADVALALAKRAGRNMVMAA